MAADSTVENVAGPPVGSVEAAFRLETLYNIAAALSSARTTSDVLDVIAGTLREYPGAESASVFVREDDRWVAVRGDGSRVPDDAIACAGSACRPLVAAHGAHAFAMIPLVFDGRARGVACAGFANRRHFDEGELHFLAAVGLQCGEALERCLLADSVRAMKTQRDRTIAEFREMADSMPQLVWVTDAAGSLTYVNRRWYEQTGMTVEETLAGDWARGLHPDDCDRCIAGWRRSIETGEAFQAEFRLRTGGSYRWFLARAVPIRDGEGHITRWFGTSTDVDDSKRDEERLRHSQKLESIGLLAGGIAHDFNNLLTGIMGNASLLLDEFNPAARAERITEVIAGAEKAANLTRQLLAYAGKGQFVQRDIDVSRAVSEMADLVQFSIPKSIDLAINVQRRLPLVRMDPGQLQQVLMNLIINAGEAIGEGTPGRITISTLTAQVEEPFVDASGEEAAAGRYVCIAVCDTGGGIGADVRARVFDPFFTTKFTGRGLGLAAVAGILRSQKGAITVESSPRGSTFQVYLPVADGPGSQAGEAEGAEGSAAILVVDDEPMVRDFIASVLRRRGYRVLTASDGRDALAICDREAEIGLAIIDVVMPAMGANDLLAILKARDPKLKILLTSGYSESEARRLCAAYPGAAFVQKPYTAQVIGQIVEDLLLA